jgi:selenophosphate synthase
MPDDEDFHLTSWAHVTDVSGHGLIGAATQAAEYHGLQISLNMSAEHAMSPEVFSIPEDCL